MSSHHRIRQVVVNACEMINIKLEDDYTLNDYKKKAQHRWATSNSKMVYCLLNTHLILRNQIQT